GLRADRVQKPPLLRDRARDAALVAQGMPMPRLAEPPDQDVVARLEEDDRRDDAPALERTAHRAQRHLGIARTHVEHDRDAGEAVGIIGYDLRELRQQLAGQVVDDHVAQVLEELGGGGLPSPGETRQDHDRLLGGRLRDRLAGRFGHRPVRLMTCTVTSKRTYIVRPSTTGLTMSVPGVITAAMTA